MPALERNCTTDCMDTYLGDHSDWVDVETVISTSPDQIGRRARIAAAGMARRTGGAISNTSSITTSLNFYSFISAQVRSGARGMERHQGGGVLHPEHPWNVPRMVNSIKKSLDVLYGEFRTLLLTRKRGLSNSRASRNSRRHFRARCRIRSRSDSSPISTHPDDIDMVFYVVAHEMGHQWWAHQVVGANMQGATLLSRRWRSIRR